MEIAAEFASVRTASRPAVQVGLSGLEDRFVQNWGGLARVFGMSEEAGQVHAVAYLSPSALCANEIAERLNMDSGECGEQLEKLIGLGALRAVASDSEGGARYEAERDPWAWFMQAIRERGRTEVQPILASVRGLHDLAREAQRQGNLSSDQRARMAHIVKFSQFVDQLASMMESFMSLGAGPLMAAMKMATRFMPRA